MKIVCYHHNDADGRLSAALVKKAHPRANIKFIECEYGADIPFWFTKEGYDKCIIVDFAFEPHQMKILHNDYKDNFVWIDHHKTAKEKNPVLWKECRGSRDESSAACMLTHQYYFPVVIPHNVVNYVNDYDIWKFEFGLETHYFALENKDIEDIDEWVRLSDNTDKFYEMIQNGKKLFEFRDKQLQKVIKNGKEIKIKDYKCLLVNQTIDPSRCGELILEKGYDIAIMWNYKNNIGVIVNLRSKNDIDVSLIAKENGGGGHKNASGFETTLTHIEKLIKND